MREKEKKKEKKRKGRDKEDTREEEKMYNQIVRLFNAARHQLITRALLADGARVFFFFFIPFLRGIKLRRASDYENFESRGEEGRARWKKKRGGPRVVRGWSGGRVRWRK